MVSAKLNNLRISPRKVRLVASLIRGMNIIQAQKQLHFLSKRSAEPILKLLNSAVANAKNNVKMDSDKLIISEIFVDGGPVLKRSMPRAFGRAFAIRKRTSHITIILKEKEEEKAKNVKRKTQSNNSKFKTESNKDKK